jgi:phosphoribosylaminoimidazolecarboxamide formyltransferase/IMP cyclohydrolase
VPRRALLSLTDKSDVIPFAQGLARRDFELLSTGGTARVLREAGLEVTDVAQVTGFPEMLGGRVKTLHPRVHGALLGLRDDVGHRAAMAEHGIEPIDVVAVNLYAFAQTVAKPGVGEAEVIENIDIGGPSMIRSAAKNHRSVWVVTEPCDYDRVLDGLDAEADDPADALALRRELAAKAYRTTAAYDAAISSWFAGRLDPAGLAEHPVVDFGPGVALRYGENPKQAARFHRAPAAREASVALAAQLAGKALSYNNIMDADAALELVKEFDGPAVAVIKHTNPCGCGTGRHLLEAFERAWSGDPQSAFGGILAFNRPVDAALAERVAKPEHFLEIVLAPAFHEAAVELLTTGAKWGKNVRLLAVGELGERDPAELAVRKVTGGWLVQQRDLGFDDETREVVSARAPSAAEWADLEFCWRVAKHVKSNAIVLARNGAVVGVGAGQMSRVDSARIAAWKSQEAAKAAGLSEPLANGSVVASDAFFPFADGLLAAAEAGATAVIQPGGSMRDAEVIKAADEAGLAMVFTGTRHFRH